MPTIFITIDRDGNYIFLHEGGFGRPIFGDWGIGYDPASAVLKNYHV
jgi:hypothetical protein